MTRTRALLLALAVEAAAPRATSLARFHKRKTAFVAGLVIRADEYRMYGLVEDDQGVDVLWRWTGRPRLAPMATP